MKSMITNDLHLGISHNDQIWLDQSVKLIQDIIDECHRRDIFTLTILGDLFHDRKNLNVKTIYTAMKIADMLKMNNIKVILLLGNHDVFYKTENTVHSLQMFNEYDNMSVIEKPTVIENIGFVPWNCDINLECKYLFGHFEINQFPVTNSRIFEKSNLNISDFANYDKVISGHFHIPSTRNNITYLGAPYHMTFNDVGTLRGFYCWDEGNLEFIEFDGVKFVYVSTEEIPDKKKIEGNVVKLIFEKDYGTVENNKLMEKIQSYNPLRFATDFSKITNEVKSVESEQIKSVQIKSNKEILFDFIDANEHPPYIDNKKIKKIIDTLLEVE